MLLPWLPITAQNHAPCLGVRGSCHLLVSRGTVTTVDKLRFREVQGPSHASLRSGATLCRVRGGG